MKRYIFTRDMWAGVEEAMLSDRGFSRLLHAVLDDAFCGADRSQELTAANSALFFDLQLDAAAADEQDSAAGAVADRFIFTPAMWEILQRAQLPDRKLRAAVAAAVESIFCGEDRTAGLGQSIRTVARVLRKRSLDAAARAAALSGQDELVEAYRARRLSASSAERSAPEARPDADEAQDPTAAHSEGERQTIRPEGPEAGGSTGLDRNHTAHVLRTTDCKTEQRNTDVQAARDEAPGWRQAMTRYVFTRDMWTRLEEAELSDRGFCRLMRTVLDDAFCGVDRSQVLTAANSVLFIDLRLDAAAADEQDSAAGPDADRFIFTPAMWEMLQRAKLPDRHFRTVIAAAAGSIFSGSDRTALLGQNIRAVARSLRRRSLEAAASAAALSDQDHLAQAYRARRLAAATPESLAPEAHPGADGEQESSAT